MRIVQSDGDNSSCDSGYQAGSLSGLRQAMSATQIVVPISSNITKAITLCFIISTNHEKEVQWHGPLWLLVSSRRLQTAPELGTQELPFGKQFHLLNKVIVV